MLSHKGGKNSGTMWTSEFTVSIRVRIRPLGEGSNDKEDLYESNFLPLLAQLSTVGQIPKDFFQDRISQIVKNPLILMAVAEDSNLNRICASGTMVVEPKFIHHAGHAGHLEDLVVDRVVRRKGIGRELVAHLLRFARSSGCYKAILDCSEDNVSFYESCGFKRKECSMSCYFKAAPRKSVNLLGAEDDEWHNESALKSHDAAQSNTQTLNELLQPFLEGNLLTRQLEKGDYHKNFLKVLAQLTSVGNITEKEFGDQFDIITKSGDQTIIVIENTMTEMVVAAGTLVFEPKFIHSAGLVGHIEDVVVDSGTRGLGLGRKIITRLRDIAFNRGCYKVVLDCANKNTEFYGKCGFSFSHSPVCMAYYFDEHPEPVVKRSAKVVKV